MTFATGSPPRDGWTCPWFRRCTGRSITSGSSTAAWAHPRSGTDPLGDDHYADATLPDTADATGYGIHPALLDAALHPLAGDAGEAALRLGLPPGLFPHLTRRGGRAV
jgi:hypothetical protein